MKKFLLTILLIMFTSLSANATYSVHFNNTGHPVSVSRGISPARSIHRFGSNATFSPGYRRAAAPCRRNMATGQHRYSNNPYNNSYKQARPRTIISSNTAQASRFNKNYSIPTSRSYSRGGITYYN